MKVFGIDTLEFGLKINNYKIVFGDFLLELEELKEKSQNNYKSEIININKCNFEVSAKGQGFYKYKIQNDEFIVCFMKDSLENTPEIFVRFLSTFLWEYGYINAFENFLKWFKSFEVSISEIKISRLDICFDTDEIEFLPTDCEKIFSRARKKEIKYTPDSINYESKIFTGFVIGKGSQLLCRIYNKSIEIKKSSKKWFEDIWKEFCWNQENTVWRIEFQIRRKTLKEFKLDTIDDIIKSVNNLWAYLTQKWLTIKVRGKDKNSSRWKVDKRWVKVQKAEEQYLSVPMIRERIRKGNLKTIYNQAAGLILSITAKEDVDTIEESLNFLKEFMIQKQNEGKIDINDEIEKRKNRFIQENS